MRVPDGFFWLVALSSPRKRKPTRLSATENLRKTSLSAHRRRVSRKKNAPAIPLWIPFLQGNIFFAKRTVLLKASNGMNFGRIVQHLGCHWGRLPHWHPTRKKLAAFLINCHCQPSVVFLWASCNGLFLLYNIVVNFSLQKSRKSEGFPFRVFSRRLK